MNKFPNSKYITTPHNMSYYKTTLLDSILFEYMHLCQTSEVMHLW